MSNNLFIPHTHLLCLWLRWQFNACGKIPVSFQDVIPDKYRDDRTKYLLQPSGKFLIGGPRVSWALIAEVTEITATFSALQGDAGLTGRKTVVDAYGGWGGSGGGAFSGKDSSKVDRSANYALRQVAKSLVAAKLVRRVSIQVSKFYFVYMKYKFLSHLRCHMQLEYLTHFHFMLNLMELVQNQTKNWKKL